MVVLKFNLLRIEFCFGNFYFQKEKVIFVFKKKYNIVIIFIIFFLVLKNGFFFKV